MMGPWPKAALASAVLLSGAWGFVQGRRAALPSAEDSTEDRAPIVDATGASMSPRAFARIVSASTRADQVLWAMIETGTLDASRVIAVTEISRKTGPPFAQFAGVESLDHIEAIVGMRPDLVLLNGFTGARHVARLEDEGLDVFDLGPLDGLDGFIEDAKIVFALLEQREAGQAWTARFRQRMRSIAADVARRPSGLYVLRYGRRLFGGGPGTSYHDVLIYGGLRDAAEVPGWPQYDPEDLLRIDPEWIVTQPGASPCTDTLALQACNGRVVEIPELILGDPGTGMLEAAERVRARVHGIPPPPLGVGDDER